MQYLLKNQELTDLCTTIKNISESDYWKNRSKSYSILASLFYPKKIKKIQKIFKNRLDMYQQFRKVIAFARDSLNQNSHKLEPSVKEFFNLINQGELDELKKFNEKIAATKNPELFLTLSKYLIRYF